MDDLKSAVADIPDFPKPGILFRDITPLLRTRFDATIDGLEELFTEAEWAAVDAVAARAAAHPDAATDARYAALVDGAVLAALDGALAGVVADATAALAAETRTAFPEDGRSLRVRLHRVAEPHRVAARAACRFAVAALEAAAARGELGLDAARRGERAASAACAGAVGAVDAAVKGAETRLTVGKNK